MTSVSLQVIDVAASTHLESQSGLQMLRPRIFGALHDCGSRDVAAIIMHPASNFMAHYLLEPLAQRGVAAFGLNSRYVNNDATLIMERVIADLGAGVRHLRSLGYHRVVLVGNSGGAALVSFYQAQAERPTLVATADGTQMSYQPGELEPADGLALCAAHAGRSRLLLDWIDPAATDEADPLATDVTLDMYAPHNGPPYAQEFLDRFAIAQHKRRDRIEDWAVRRLEQLRALPAGPRDQAFVVYRTHADPRCLDLSLDANDRVAGSVWGNAFAVNHSANAMGRTTTLNAFLSQWSSRSQADGPDNLSGTTAPLVHLTHTADQSVFPSTVRLWRKAAGQRWRNVEIKGGNHYLSGQPQLVDLAAEVIAEFSKSLR